MQLTATSFHILCNDNPSFLPLRSSYSAAFGGPMKMLVLIPTTFRFLGCLRSLPTICLRCCFSRHDTSPQHSNFNFPIFSVINSYCFQYTPGLSIFLRFNYCDNTKKKSVRLRQLIISRVLLIKKKQFLNQTHENLLGRAFISRGRE